MLQLDTAALAAGLDRGALRQRLHRATYRRPIHHACSSSAPASSRPISSQTTRWYGRFVKFASGVDTSAVHKH